MVSRVEIRGARTALLLVLALAVAVLTAALPARALADVDPAGCTSDLQYDPSIPTYNSVLGLPLGGGATGTASRQLSAVLQTYQHALAVATQNNPRVRILEKSMGVSALGRPITYSVVGTPDNIANLDAGRNDAGFWSGVREGTISTADGLAGVQTRPAFTWVTGTPHGNEPAAGEASMRLLYELAARMDCSNARRLQNLDTFILPVTNPDGRDLNTRTTAWGFDPNRDRGTRVNQENDAFTAGIVKYPGVFVIDAHQQGSGYFFPPDEDGVHHEISTFALDFIQNDIGPMLQRLFNDQSTVYQNYNTYDLFAPIYGDSVPTLLDGAAGMTYEKGSSENYGKQVYDHYLAMDATDDVTSDQKEEVLTGWVKQWGEAREHGAECALQPNKLVSPLHTEIRVLVPRVGEQDGSVCGYYFTPENTGDTARLIKELTSVGVHVYRLNQDVNAGGVDRFGPTPTQLQGTLKAGTLWIPMAQGQKHWIQAVLGENPYLPFPYNYDVTEWSYPLTRGLADSGILRTPMPAGISMTEITDPAYGAVTGAGSPVYAFDTDSAAALGLVTELLADGVSVGRAGAPFSAANRTFKSGAALVDGASLTANGIDIASLAATRETPVFGLPNYPVARYPMAVPKIGLLSSATATTYPSSPNGLGAGTGACSGGYCEALFVLTQKDKVPASLIKPVLLSDLTSGKLISEHYTALVNPGVTFNLGTGNVITPGLQAIQDFVNQGGRYIGDATNGTTTARNAGVTCLNTQTIANISTPGSLYDGTFDTTSPLAWGYDAGGWIYRDLGTNPNYDPATLDPSTLPAANTCSKTIPKAKSAVTFGPTQPSMGQMYSYGYDVNAVGPTQLANRPAMVDQPFGSGRVLMLGTDPYYRAWTDGQERLVLNGILYPIGASVAPTASPTVVAAAAKPVAPAIVKSKLPVVKADPDKGGADANRDLLITVRRSDGAKLRKAVKAAHLSKKLRSKVRFRTTRSSVTLVMKNVRTSNTHTREVWVGRIMGGLGKAHVTALAAQI
jgi:hypothetical protein